VKALLNHLSSSSSSLGKQKYERRRKKKKNCSTKELIKVSPLGESTTQEVYTPTTTSCTTPPPTYLQRRWSVVVEKGGKGRWLRSDSRKLSFLGLYVCICNRTHPQSSLFFLFYPFFFGRYIARVMKKRVA
jgi:hypothetical protein